MYNVGAVLLCTKCFAVHKPGQLSLTKVLRESCEGASRAHKKKKTEWAQKYLKETTTPTDLFKTTGTRPQAELYRPLSQTSTSAAEPKQATHPKPEAKPRRGEAASPAANSVPVNLRDPGTARPFSARPPKPKPSQKQNPKLHPKVKQKLLLLLKALWPRPSQKQQDCDLQTTILKPVFPAAPQYLWQCFGSGCLESELHPCL